MEKIYISGKITGLPYEEAFKMFDNAESKLQTQLYEVVNPMKIIHEHDLSWESYMKEDLKAMLDCDAIYLLKNYKDSKGAMIEYKLALDLKLRIVHE